MAFPLGYVIGRTIGWSSGVDAHTLRTSTDAILSATRDLDVDNEIARELIQCLRANPTLEFKRVADNLPTQPRPSKGLFAGSLLSPTIWNTPQPSCHPLARSPGDTLVAIRVRSIGFNARTGHAHVNGGGTMPINPPLALELCASVEVIRVRDWSPVGGLTIRYEGTAMKFTEWAAHDSTPLKNEIAAALQGIREEIAARVCFDTPPPIPSTTARNPSFI